MAQWSTCRNAARSLNHRLAHSQMQVGHPSAHAGNAHALHIRPIHLHAQHPGTTSTSTITSTSPIPDAGNPYTTRQKRVHLRLEQRHQFLQDIDANEMPLWAASEKWGISIYTGREIQKRKEEIYAMLPPHTPETTKRNEKFLDKVLIRWLVLARGRRQISGASRYGMVHRARFFNDTIRSINPGRAVADFEASEEWVEGWEKRVKLSTYNAAPRYLAQLIQGENELKFDEVELEILSRLDKYKYVLPIVLKAQILEDLKNLSQYEVALKWSVRFDKITAIVKHEAKIHLAADRYASASRRIQGGRQPLLDEAVYQWLICARARDIPITKEILESKAQFLLRALGSISPDQATACATLKGRYGWRKAWEKRYSTLLRASESHDAFEFAQARAAKVFSEVELDTIAKMVKMALDGETLA